MAFTIYGFDEIFGDTTDAKTSTKDGGTAFNAVDCLFCRSVYFVLGGMGSQDLEGGAKSLLDEIGKHGKVVKEGEG